jgi:hypothetical protein
MRRETGPDVHLYIDRLILDGLPVDGVQTRQLQTAVESELTRLLTEGSLTEEVYRGGAVPVVGVDGIQLTADATPAQIGMQIAQSIYSGISDKQ